MVSGRVVQSAAPAAMTIVQSLLLGIIEGITEYLPVSSTGHLIVAERFMGIGTGDELSKQAADAFAICIQGGAILAVLGLYWPRVMQMLRGLLGKDAVGFRLLVAIVCGFLPAAVIGLAFNDWIEAHLFGLWPVVGAWLAGGVAILAVAWWRRGHPTPGGGRELAEITWKMALIIGFMQCVAMWPGTSRSLMTIVGGVMVGLSLSAAVEFSFLLGVVTLTAATLKKAVWPVSEGGDAYDTLFGGFQLMLDKFGQVNMIVGVVAATVSAAIAVKWMVGYLQKHGMSLFGWYRIGIGVAVAAMIMAGMIEP